MLSRFETEVRSQLTQLAKLVKKYERGDMPKSDWLDKLVFRRMEEMHAVCCDLSPAETNVHSAQAETDKSENLFLYIDLPRFDFPVVFTEPVRLLHVSKTLIVQLTKQESHASSLSTSGQSSSLHPPSTPSSVTSDPRLWLIVDPDMARENPVEDKHRRLVRSHRNGPLDRELKPNAKIRDELNVNLLVFCQILSLTLHKRKSSIIHLVSSSP